MVAARQIDNVDYLAVSVHLMPCQLYGAPTSNMQCNSTCSVAASRHACMVSSPRPGPGSIPGPDSGIGPGCGPGPGAGPVPDSALRPRPGRGSGSVLVLVLSLVLVLLLLLVLLLVLVLALTLVLALVRSWSCP
jgi:hypothetical protein